jgi:hypothetical protein
VTVGRACAAVRTRAPTTPQAQVGYAITRLPEDFTPHKQIKRVYEQRRKMVETGEGVDWAMAEALAFGTLLSEGAPRAPRARRMQGSGSGCLVLDMGGAPHNAVRGQRTSLQCAQPYQGATEDMLGHAVKQTALVPQAARSW